MTVERDIFRSYDGLVVRGLAGGAVRFVTLSQAATLSPIEIGALTEALRKHAVASPVDDHLERGARLPAAAE
jgi:hypothetical protein